MENFDHPEWLFDLNNLEKTFRSLGITNEITEMIIREVTMLKGNPASVGRFLTFYHAWIAGDALKVDDPSLSLWNALAVVAAFPRAFSLHKERGIPWSTTMETLSDFPRRLLLFRAENGHEGFDAQAWMRNHVLGRLYQIGRLQYGLGTFDYSVNVYDTDRGQVALARNKVACDSNGWKTNEETAPGVWHTTLIQDAAGIRGNPVLPDGRINRESVTLPPDSRCLLQEDSPVLHVHIPSGEKLTLDTCRASLDRSLPFFRCYFPETDWRGLCCGTWLLDPALKKILPPSSNIVGFAGFFSPLPALPVAEEHYLHWIFGKTTSRQAIKMLPDKTRLQEAILRYLESGGTLRNGAGYIRACSPGRG